MSRKLTLKKLVYAASSMIVPLELGSRFKNSEKSDALEICREALLKQPIVKEEDLSFLDNSLRASCRAVLNDERNVKYLTLGLPVDEVLKSPRSANSTRHLST